ncbi:hypothetical protein EL22_06150 [Halostagnicola sp. A56]|uniref:hypothetical protein n=1 Tax=Halostagnicola sp. A56 TaxID=1495067 RepID=UPI00049EB067|nr:hypothetical protein [Halostagnicola sp. A56]KDE58229.1 hypothetical protein EL22_06150 [Halostagnicola sp. A56]
MKVQIGERQATARARQSGASTGSKRIDRFGTGAERSVGAGGSTGTGRSADAAFDRCWWVDRYGTFGRCGVRPMRRSTDVGGSTDTAP